MASELSGARLEVVFGHGRSAVYAVRGVDISIGSNEIVGLVGESGSGKTTVGRVLAGFQSPTQGEVRLDGLSAALPGRTMSPMTRRRVQMILQDPYTSLNPTQRAWECVAEVLKVCHGLTRSIARHDAIAQLGRVGINPAQAQQYPQELSGGQRQRVSVARALAARPAFLVADEPTSSIDQSAQAQVLRLLASIRAQSSLGILFITHDLRVVRHIAQRVYVMLNGEIAEAGTTERIFGSPSHSYTISLIDAIPGRRVRDEIVVGATRIAPVSDFQRS